LSLSPFFVVGPLREHEKHPPRERLRTRPGV
jgi:hypothetical protein